MWILPFLCATCLLLLIQATRESALLSRASSLLVHGHGAEAGELLAELKRSPWTGAQACTGLELAAALTGEHTTVEEWRDFDPSAFPVPLIIRTAFERGEFPAALRLTALAQRLGVRTVALVTAAAWIEAGKLNQALELESLDLALPGAMARRAAHYLETPEEQGGVLLRDRDGRPLGTLESGEKTPAGESEDDGQLELAPGVPPELVPRAVAGAAIGRSAGSLRLTLDLELSRAAYSAFGRYRGSIVILDPATGEILAAVSDRRTWLEGGTPAFEQLREPASIAKLITATAARRAGLRPDAELARMRCRGHASYAGKRLYCPAIVGRLRSLDRAMAVSCNVAFANLGVKVGRAGLLAELRRYGFGERRGGFAGGKIVQARGDDRQLADLSIGLEATEITPLHGALLAAVMANDGVMPEPILIAAEDGRLGLHPRPLLARDGRRVIDRRWVPELVSAMEAVVRRGTAQRVWPPPSFPVAMKTGTASDPRYGFHVNYIGIGPMPDPRLAFCVRITDRPTSAKVRYAAQQVTHRLLRNLGRIAEKRGWRSPGQRPAVPTRIASATRPSAPRSLRPAPSVTAR